MPKSTGKPIIEIQDLCKKFPSKKVLDHLSLFLYEGDFLGITGESGSGKSTLINIMGLMDTFDSGKYLLDNRDVFHLPENELSFLRCRRFGFIFQMYYLLEDYSVKGNILLPKIYSRSPIDEPYFSLLIDNLGIADLIKQKVKFLSGGEKQRVAIARALINNPSIIIADEPTGNLDEKNTWKVMDILHKLNAEGKTVIIVSHDPSVIEACPRQYLLSGGQLWEKN